MIKIAQGVCDCLTECPLMGVYVSVCSYAPHKILFYKDFVKGKSRDVKQSFPALF